MIGKREQEILRLYEEWDPETTSSVELVDQIGISKARLYAVLRKHKVTPKSKRGDRLVDDSYAALERRVAALENKLEGLIVGLTRP